MVAEQVSAPIVNTMVFDATGIDVDVSTNTAETVPGSLKSDVAGLTDKAVGRGLKMTDAVLLRCVMPLMSTKLATALSVPAPPVLVRVKVALPLASVVWGAKGG